MLGLALHVPIDRVRGLRPAFVSNVRTFLGVSGRRPQADSAEAAAVLAVACGLSAESELPEPRSAPRRGRVGRAARRRLLVALGEPA